jgi:L-lactate dehydrogenase complex protein LldF
MLLENRHMAAKEGLNGFSENMSWKLWRRGMLSRTLMNSAGAGIKNMMLEKVFGSTWLKRRSGTHFAPKSFNKLWKENNSK